MAATAVPSGCPLTARQLEVMRLTALGGMQAQEIGRQLGITASTVQSHRNAAYRRLGVYNAVRASMVCLRSGWFRRRITPESSLPETSAQAYLRAWEGWLRSDDGGDFCMDLLGRLGLKLLRDEGRRLRVVRAS